MQLEIEGCACQPAGKNSSRLPGQSQPSMGPRAQGSKPQPIAHSRDDRNTTGCSETSFMHKIPGTEVVVLHATSLLPMPC